MINLQNLLEGLFIWDKYKESNFENSEISGKIFIEELNEKFLLTSN